MESFELFCQRNRGFGGYGRPSEQEHLRNYEMAKQVEQTYQRLHGFKDEPQIGDVVEFADDYQVFTHGLITENLYGGSEHGMLSICEHGSSHTDGEYFSTSGGVFHHVHKSRLQPAGTDVNVVWTWGCYGAGGSQGVYLPLQVRRWVIPHGQPTKRSWVYFRGQGRTNCHGQTLPAVSISNCLETYNAMCFKSISAFRAWADYVGYRYRDDCGGTERKVSSQRLCDKCYCDPSWTPPEGAKPIKVIRNATLKDGWVVTTDDCIMTYWPNIYDPDRKAPRFGSPEYEAEFREYQKYRDNPMGV